MELPGLSKLKRSDTVNLVRILLAQILATENRIDNYDAQPTRDSYNFSKPLYLDSLLPKSASKTMRHTGQRPKYGKKVSALEMVVNPDFVVIRSLPSSVTHVADLYLDPRTSGIASYNQVAPSTAVPSEYCRTPATADPAGDDPEESWDVRDRYKSGRNSHVHIDQGVIQNHPDSTQWVILGNPLFRGDITEQLLRLYLRTVHAIDLLTTVLHPLKHELF